MDLYGENQFRNSKVNDKKNNQNNNNTDGNIIIFSNRNSLYNILSKK